MSRATTARAVIARVAAEHPGLDTVELLKLIDASYPFGERKYWPYRMWLKARQAWIRQRNGKDSIAMPPIDRKCAACGSQPGHACRSFDAVGPGFDMDTFHDARMTPPSGPLFGDAE